MYSKFAGLAFYRDIGDRLGEANTLQAIGRLQADLTVGLEYCQAALKLYRQIGTKYSQLAVVTTLSSVVRTQVAVVTTLSSVVMTQVAVVTTLSFVVMTQFAVVMTLSFVATDKIKRR